MKKFPNSIGNYEKKPNKLIDEKLFNQIKKLRKKAKGLLTKSYIEKLLIKNILT